MDRGGWLTTLGHEMAGGGCTAKECLPHFRPGDESNWAGVPNTKLITSNVVLTGGVLVYFTIACSFYIASSTEMHYPCPSFVLPLGCQFVLRRTRPT